MTSKSKQFSIVAVCAAVIILGLSSCGGSDTLRVATEDAEARSLTETVEGSGKIYPETEVKISSDVSGEIVELLVSEGDSVKAGQLLLKVRPDTYESAVQRANAVVSAGKAQAATSRSQISQVEAQISQLKASLGQVQAQFDNAKLTYERSRKLHAEGVIADVELEQAEVAYRTAESSVQAAKANIKGVEASLDAAKQGAQAASFNVNSAQATANEARENLSRTEVYAPNSGIISMLNVKQGERVVGTGMMGGTELLRIADLTRMEVQVDISENEIVRVSVGDKVDIEVDAYLDSTFTGTVTKISNSSSVGGAAALVSNDQVANYTVNIRIDAESYKGLMGKGKMPFRPMMSASVAIKTRTVKDVLSVPIQAVTTREEDGADPEDDLLEVVFVVEGDSVTQRTVRSGLQDETNIQIVSGLNKGDQVVIEPYTAISTKLKQGMEVEVVTKDELFKKKGR